MMPLPQMTKFVFRFQKRHTHGKRYKTETTHPMEITHPTDTIHPVCVFLSMWKKTTRPDLFSQPSARFSVKSRLPSARCTGESLLHCLSRCSSCSEFARGSDAAHGKRYKTETDGRWYKTETTHPMDTTHPELQCTQIQLIIPVVH